MCIRQTDQAKTRDRRTIQRNITKVFRETTIYRQQNNEGKLSYLLTINRLEIGIKLFNLGTHHKSAPQPI